MGYKAIRKFLAGLISGRITNNNNEKKNLHKLKNIYLNKSSNVEFSLMPCGIAKKKKKKSPIF